MTSTASFSAVELLDSFVSLERSIATLRTYLKDRDAAPYSLAPHLTTESPHGLIADTLCKLFLTHEELLEKIANTNFRVPTHGVVVIDEEGVDLVNKASVAKKAFSDIAIALNVDGHTKRGLADGRHRSEHIRSLFAGHGLSLLSLQDCYRKLHIVEGTPKRISFTWQRSHKKWKELTLDQATTLCKQARIQTPDTNEQDVWIEKLHSINTAKFRIVRVSNKRPQLKANAPYTISSPSILMVNGTFLPEVRYKSLEELNQRKVTRSDKVFNEENSLGFLDLYYLPITGKNIPDELTEYPADDGAHDE